MCVQWLLSEFYAQDNSEVMNSAAIVTVLIAMGDFFFVNSVECPRGLTGAG